MLVPLLIISAGHSSSSSFLQNPYYFMFASLAKPDEDVELHWLKDGKTRCTTGSVVSSLYHLKDSENQNEDAGFFVFPDLSVRTEGSYRLKLSLFEVVGYVLWLSVNIVAHQPPTLARTCITASLFSLLRFTCTPPRNSPEWRNRRHYHARWRTRASKYVSGRIFVFEKKAGVSDMPQPIPMPLPVPVPLPSNGMFDFAIVFTVILTVH